MTVGSKAQVFHGTVDKTSGGLTRKDLMQNKHGRIVSRRKHALGQKQVKKLFAMGFKPTKGKFMKMSRKMMVKSGKKRATRKGARKGKRSTRKMKGGNFFAELSGSM
jgi:hypothetical protein